MNTKENNPVSSQGGVQSCFFLFPVELQIASAGSTEAEFLNERVGTVEGRPARMRACGVIR